MLRVPEAKNQARLLSKTLKTLLGITVGHQDALEVIAKLNGQASWRVLAAQSERAPSGPTEAELLHDEIPGDPQLPLWDVLLTVDTSMSRHLRVHARNEEDALEVARNHAADTGGAGFEVDEGNYRGASDYYLGDPDENITRVAALPRKAAKSSRKSAFAWISLGEVYCVGHMLEVMYRPLEGSAWQSQYRVVASGSSQELGIVDHVPQRVEMEAMLKQHGLIKKMPKGFPLEWALVYETDKAGGENPFDSNFLSEALALRAARDFLLDPDNKGVPSMDLFTIEPNGDQEDRYSVTREDFPEDKVYLKVEWDPDFCGGAYSGTGRQALVPLARIDAYAETGLTEEAGVHRAFADATGQDSRHIIYYTVDDRYTADGELIRD